MRAQRNDLDDWGQIMKLFMQVMIVVVVFTVSGELAEYAGEIAPGTPTQKLHAFFEADTGADIFTKLNSETWRQLVIANSNWILFLYLPIACIVSSASARILKLRLAHGVGIIAAMVIIQMALMCINGRYGLGELMKTVEYPISGTGASTTSSVLAFLLCVGLSILTMKFRAFALSRFRD